MVGLGAGKVREGSGEYILYGKGREEGRVRGNMARAEGDGDGGGGEGAGGVGVGVARARVATAP